MKRSVRIFLLMLALLMVAAGGVYLSSRPAFADPSPAQQAIDIAARQPVIAAALTHFPDWSATADEDDPDENTWYVTFYEDQQQEEWLAEALVDLDTAEVLEFYAPVFLTPEEEARQQAEVEALVLADAQVLALLGDPEDWQRYSSYDPYEVAWHVQFEHGLDAWDVIVVRDDDDRWQIETIRDPWAFNEEEQQQANRDKAIELAFESDKLWQTLEAYDDWTALSSPLTEAQWGVSFLAGDKEVYFVRVDIVAWVILEESARSNRGDVYLPLQVTK